MGVVPVIDVAGDRLQVARAIDDACRRIGFLQIVGHGLDADVEDRAWALTSRFFQLADGEKMSIAIPPGDAYGYGPFRSERLAASVGEDTPPDLKETFSIGPFACPPNLADDETAAFVYSPNRWPSSLPELQPALRNYYDALADLVERLLSLMALGLGLPPDHFDRFVDCHTSALRALHYPHVDGVVEAGQLRAGAHSDYGTLTLLRQDGAPGGLQVGGVDGRWHDVAAVPGAYVVNVGDALARWTNDRWRSTLHRVVVPPAGHAGDTSRRSIAFFHNANWDAVIECLPTCVDDRNPARYEPVTAGRHLMDKFRSTQPY